MNSLDIATQVAKFERRRFWLSLEVELAIRVDLLAVKEYLLATKEDIVSFLLVLFPFHPFFKLEVLRK